jgi:hypothetical protein
MVRGIGSDLSLAGDPEKCRDCADGVLTLKELFCNCTTEPVDTHFLSQAISSAGDLAAPLDKAMASCEWIRAI